MPMDFMHLFDV